MSIMSIEIIYISEIEIRWRPTAITVVGAVVRNGQVSGIDQCAKSLLTEDRIDGYIEFIQAIKQAMADTKPQWRKENARNCPHNRSADKMDNEGL